MSGHTPAAKKLKNARRSIEDLLILAHCEVSTNPTITVYEMEDGQEFNRRPANPYLRIERSLQKVTASFAALGDSLSAFGDQLSGLKFGGDL